MDEEFNSFNIFAIAGEDNSDYPLLKPFRVLRGGVTLLSVAANIFTLFVILKFKKLRQGTTNTIIANFIIVETAYILTTVQMITDSWLEATQEYVLFVYSCLSAMVVYLFVVLLLCNWYLKTYKETEYVKFTRIVKFLEMGIYITLIVTCGVVTHFCHKGSRFMYNLWISLVCVRILFVFVTAVTVVYVMKNRIIKAKGNVGLILANIFLVFWIPTAILDMLIVIDYVYPFLPFTPEAPVIIDALGISSPVFRLLYLFYYVDTFNKFIKKTFKCRCRDHENEVVEENSVVLVCYSG